MNLPSMTTNDAALVLLNKLGFGITQAAEVGGSYLQAVAWLSILKFVVFWLMFAVVPLLFYAKNIKAYRALPEAEREAYTNKDDHHPLYYWAGGFAFLFMVVTGGCALFAITHLEVLLSAFSSKYALIQFAVENVSQAAHR